MLAIVAGSLQGAWAQADSWVVPASDIDLTGNTPYWIRHTATNGLNLATKAPLYGSDSWKATAVSAVAADLSDLTQVVYFKKEGARIFVYTQTADGTYKTYIGSDEAANQTWAMSAKTLTGDERPTTTDGTNKQGYLKEILPVGNTGNVFFHFVRANGNNINGDNTYLIANRANRVGTAVYDDGHKTDKANFTQWTVIPWRPLEILKNEINEVKRIYENAKVGTKNYEVRNESYREALLAAYNTANTAYNSIKSDIDGGRATLYQRLSSIQTAWSALKEAKRVFLNTAYNAPDTDKQYVVVNREGGILKWSNNAEPAVSEYVTTSIGSEHLMKFSAATISASGTTCNGYYLSPVSNSSQFLQLQRNRFSADSNKQLAANKARWRSSVDADRSNNNLGKGQV